MKARTPKLAAFITALAAAAISLAGTTASAAVPQHAATGSSTKAATPTVNTNTCTFYHAYVGPYMAIDKFTNHGLALSTDTSWPRAQVYPEPYTDSLLQCWKPLNAGDGSVMFEQAHSSWCLNIAGASKQAGASVILWPCNSQTDEDFYPYVSPTGRIQYENVNSHMCITAPNVAWAAVVQQPCSRWDDDQSFWENTHP